MINEAAKSAGPPSSHHHPNPSGNISRKMTINGTNAMLI